MSTTQSNGLPRKQFKANAHGAADEQVVRPHAMLAARASLCKADVRLHAFLGGRGAGMAQWHKRVRGGVAGFSIQLVLHLVTKTLQLFSCVTAWRQFSGASNSNGEEGGGGGKACVSNEVTGEVSSNQQSKRCYTARGSQSTLLMMIIKMKYS